MSNWSCKTSLLALKGQYPTAANIGLDRVMLRSQPLEELDGAKSKTIEDIPRMYSEA